VRGGNEVSEGHLVICHVRILGQRDRRDRSGLMDSICRRDGPQGPQARQRAWAGARSDATFRSHERGFRAPHGVRNNKK